MVQIQLRAVHHNPLFFAAVEFQTIQNGFHHQKNKPLENSFFSFTPAGILNFVLYKPPESSFSFIRSKHL